jgi:hypothetical protein
MNRHIWEGWTVQDFIDAIEPTFDRIMQNATHFNRNLFSDDKELKEWIKNEQPYYKKHIPEVYKYFKVRRQQWTI